MRTIRTIRGLRHWRHDSTRHKHRIGFVPTMGALHAGHQSLIQRARNLCDTVVVSLFVNPLQFGPTEDYQQYPRNLRQDTAFCKQEQVDVLFLPSVKEIYPSGFQTSVTVSQLTRQWEGEHRPSHFVGVGTVVTKLLNLVQPHVAIFGQKDYQQTLLIKQLVRDLGFDVRIIMCPTIRERRGLALSSRNEYLTPDQREQARLLYLSLKAGKDAILHGIRSASRIQQIMKRKIKEGPDITVDYLAVCDATTLQPRTHIEGGTVLLGAIRLGAIRLIDNLLMRKLP